jgi:hypothetical protein
MAEPSLLFPRLLIAMARLIGPGPPLKRAAETAEWHGWHSGSARAVMSMTS